MDRFASEDLACTTCQVYRFADDPLAACAALEQEGYQCQCRTQGAPSAHDQVMCRSTAASDGTDAPASTPGDGSCDTIGPSPEEAAARGGCRWGTGATLCGLSTVSFLLVTSLVV